jgi:hypothetical protein
MVMRKIPLGVGKARHSCCRFVRLGGWWVVLFLVGLFFMGGGLYFSLVGGGLFCSCWFYWVFVAELWFFLCILPVYLGAPYAFINKVFLLIKKKQ